MIRAAALSIKEYGLEDHYTRSTLIDMHRLQSLLDHGREFTTYSRYFILTALHDVTGSADN